MKRAFSDWGRGTLDCRFGETYEMCTTGLPIAVGA